MLRIRLSRTGKKRQPSFRIVVAEHTAPIKGKYVEVVGHYQPATNPKRLEVKKERVEYWISKGAQPTDSVAALLKKDGMAKMEQYLEPRDKKRKKKKAGEEPAAAVPAPAAAPTEAKAAAEPEAPAAEAVSL